MRHVMGILLLSLTMSANAAYLELNSGDYCCSSPSAGGPGTGRGIGFQANSTFTIDSIGIFGDLNNQSFDAVIYSSTDGNQANSILASATSLAGGAGNTWNDIALNFTFNANDYYVILWRPSDGGTTWVNTNLDYYFDSSLPVTVGPATLINGVEGFNAERFDNSLHANLRVNAVPIPAAAWLFASGLGLLGWMKRRRAG